MRMIRRSRIARPKAQSRVGDHRKLRFVCRSHRWVVADARRGAPVNLRAVEFKHGRAIRVAKVAGAIDDQIEHRLRIAGRGRHRLQHIDGGRLVFDPFAIFGVSLRQCRGARLQLYSARASRSLRNSS